MPDLYPPLEPFATGLLDTGDGHQVYWERCGTRGARPALLLHGGPGSGCSINQRRLFDPQRFDAVLVDQRGSGRSRPRADVVATLEHNTTADLISDLERLRQQFHFERWTILGLSWGSTLAFAYAEALPERVAALVSVLVTTGSRDEVNWLTEGVGRLFPREWERFAAAVPERLFERRLVEAYAELVMDPDPAIHHAAATAWCDWEDAHVSLTPGHRRSARYDDPHFRLRFARLVTHYWSHDCFLGERGVLDNVARLDGIPGVMINGRYDVSGSPSVAWKLATSWPTSRLEVIDDAGHGGGQHLQGAMIAALDEFAIL